MRNGSCSIQGSYTTSPSRAAFESLSPQGSRHKSRAVEPCPAANVTPICVTAAVTVGLDIGTTSIKAVAADDDGRVVARARVATG